MKNIIHNSRYELKLPHLNTTKKGLILVFLLLIFVLEYLVGNAADTKASTTYKTQQTIQVKLPDGLYLFQPKIIQMYKHRTENKNDVFSPLFIIKKGKLLDPYLIAKKIGIKKFMKEYVTEKSFNVYVGTEMIGRLSNVKIKLFDTNTCPSGTLLFDIEGTGIYEGKLLPGRYENNSVYAIKKDDLILNSATVKAVAVPSLFNKSNKMEALTVTENDTTKAVKEVKKYLIAEAMKPIEKRLINENRIILNEDESRLDFIKMLDLDNSGNQDYVGVYTLYVSNKTVSENERAGIAFNEILFVLWGSGKIEKILYGEESSPAFSLGGVIDIDQNGVQEVIVQRSCGPYVEDDINGKRIEIFQHDSSGWISIYRSALICSQIN